MNNDERVASLALASEAVDMSEDEDGSRRNTGGLCIEKSDGRNGFGTEVGEYMYANNGTIAWPVEDLTNGIDAFNNIYQYMAAEIFAPSGSLRDRIEVSAEREHEVRSGVTTLSKWLDTMWGIALYRCTNAGSGNRIVAITVHGNYVVDPSVSDETAEEIQSRRDRKALSGQTMAAALRLARSKGKDYAQAALIDAVNTGLSRFELPEPRRRLAAEEVED